MKTSVSLNKDKKRSDKSLSHKKIKSSKLKDILQDIKELQYYVSHLQISQKIPKKPQKKTSKKRSSHSTMIHSCEKTPLARLKRSKKDDNIIKSQYSINTTRKNKSSLNNSSIFNQFPPKSSVFHKIDDIYNISQNFVKSQIIHEELPLPYMSLHLENINLEKLNLELQKQLLQKQLLIQKQQKNMLKNRLKRMKINNKSSKNEYKQEYINNYQNQSNPLNKQSYQDNKIQIQIPEFNEQKMRNDHMQNENESREMNFTFSDVICKEKKERQSQQLLLSQSDLESKNINNNQRRFGEERNQNQGLNVRNKNKDKNKNELMPMNKQEQLQRQFWTILNKSQKQNPNKRWQLRQTAGDIANKLKTIRKR